MKKKVVRESCGRRMAVWSLAAMMLLGSMGMQAQGTVGVSACCKAKVATAAVAQPVADDVRAEWQQLKGDVTLYMTNDMGRNGYYDQKPIAELMGEMAGVVDPECVFAAGDIHHFNGVASLQDPLWMTNYELVYSHPDLMLDWFPVCGNHEYRGNTQAFMDYGKVSRRWMMPARYYTKVFKHGNTSVRIVMLDTTPLIDSYRKNSSVYPDACKQDAEAQLAWLDETLRNAKEDWVVVMGHHPIYADTNKKESERLDMQKRLLPVLHKYNNVAIYACGHIHNFQHIQKKATDGTVCCSSADGFSVFTVDKKQLKMSMIDKDGKIIHTITKSK